MAVKTKPLSDQGLNSVVNDASRSNEYLQELVGIEGSIRYRQMSKGDDIVGMLLRTHKNPIRASQWTIPVPDDANEVEKKAIHLANQMLFGESGTEFDALLSQILTCLDYGFSCFERYYKTYDYEGVTYLFPVLEQRMQTSVYDIVFKDKIVKQVSVDKGTIQIPFDDIIFFTLDRQGEDLRGTSILRNAYGQWKRKKVYQEWLGIGIQRSVSGIPSMQVPAGTTVESEDYQAAEQLLQNICQHESAYMITKEGWTFEVHESKFNSDQVQKAIEATNTGMTMSVLAQWTLLGQNGNGGAYALGRDQSDFFLDGLQHVVNLVVGTLNSKVIKPFLKLNFGDTVKCERVQLKGLNLNKKAGQELANTLSTLKNAGFISATVDDEILLRSNLELTKLSDEEIDLKRKNALNTLANPPQTAPLADPSQEFKQKVIAAIKNGKEVKLSEPKKKARAAYVVKIEKEVTDFMRANLLLIKDKLMADVESTLNRGQVEIQGLKNIEISNAKYRKGLEIKLASLGQEAYDKAKAGAKSAGVKLAEQITPQEMTSKVLKQFVLNQSFSTVDQQSSSILSRAILAASNGPLKGLSVPQTVSNVEKAVQDYIDSNSVDVAGSLVSVGTVNFGETQFYSEIKESLWGYRFVAVQDEDTSEICLWYHDKTYSVDSPELSTVTPPLHPNCRSYLEPIYKSDGDKPEIDDVIAPPSIQKQKSVY